MFLALKSTKHFYDSMSETLPILSFSSPLPSPSNTLIPSEPLQTLDLLTLHGSIFNTALSTSTSRISSPHASTSPKPPFFVVCSKTALRLYSEYADARLVLTVLSGESMLPKTAGKACLSNTFAAGRHPQIMPIVSSTRLMRCKRAELSFDFRQHSGRLAKKLKRLTENVDGLQACGEVGDAHEAGCEHAAAKRKEDD